MKKINRSDHSGLFCGYRLAYRAVEVLPDTPFEDEPSETVSPGWYVLGRAVDDHAEVEVVIDVGAAYGPAGEDMRRDVAEAIAVGLNGSRIGGE